MLQANGSRKHVSAAFGIRDKRQLINGSVSGDIRPSIDEYFCVDRHCRCTRAFYSDTFSAADGAGIYVADFHVYNAKGCITSWGKSHYLRDYRNVRNAVIERETWRKFSSTNRFG